jgi:polyhydroxybutyrate depolymerase
LVLHLTFLSWRIHPVITVAEPTRVAPGRVVQVLSAFLWIALSGVSGVAEAQQVTATLSPGPSDRLLDRDYRVAVTWLTMPANQGAGDFARKLSFGGRDRYYEVHVPPGYTRDKHFPLVLVLHGGGGYPSLMRYVTRMDEVSNRHGFIVVYPAGTGIRFDRLLYWNSGPVRKDPTFRAVDDVAFIAYVLDDIGRYFSLDSRRVYATGISNGAQMSFRLGAELSDRITAIGPVCGDRRIGEFFAAPPRAMPVIVFHGKKDTFLPFGGGPTPSTWPYAVVRRQPVPETIKGWVAQAGGNPQSVAESRTGQAVRYHYPPVKPGGVETEFWVLEDGGHTWPGGQEAKIAQLLGTGKVNQDISASEVMWQFFERYRLSP